MKERQMEPHQVEQLVATKKSQLADRTPTLIQAALVALCARGYVLASAGWRRWPDVHHWVHHAMQVMLTRAVSAGHEPARRRLVVALEAFDVEDDGTAEWQRAVDVVSMLVEILNDVPPAEALTNGMLGHLESTFAIVANANAESLGRPISETEAQELVPADPRWQWERDFVSGL
jgi:hypothetical protein